MSYPIHTIEHSLYWEAKNDEAVQAFYKTPRCIILFTTAHHRPLSSVRRVWSTSTYPVSCRNILMLFSQLCQGVRAASYHLAYKMKILQEFLTPPMHVKCRSHFVVFNPIILTISGEQYRQWALLYAVYILYPPNRSQIPLKFRSFP